MSHAIDITTVLGSKVGCVRYDPDDELWYVYVGDDWTYAYRDEKDAQEELARLKKIGLAR